MSIDKKTVVLIIALASIFSGCTFFDKTEFSFISAVICDDDGFASISVVFNTTGETTLMLFNPQNDVISSDIYYRGSYQAMMHLDDYRKTPVSGTYTLKAYDKNWDLIFQNEFVFKGPKPSIEKAVGYQWVEEDTLVGLNVVMENKGDLPVYPYVAEVQIEDRIYPGHVLPTVILPHRRENCFISLEGTPIMDTTVYIRLKNSDGETIVDTTTVLTPRYVTELEYKWIFNRLVLPDIKFLYEYYHNLPRLPVEDYAAYVLDMYDDRYIDLVVERLLSLNELSDDVAVINFLASFVQNLEYAEDDEEDPTYEYPRFPVETLKDSKGDCEDLAILLAALLDNKGYNVSLIRIPNHMAVGVHLDENASSYDYYIEKYYYLETTRYPSSLGRVPSEYETISNITLYPISSRPILVHSWKNATRYSRSNGVDFVKIKILVENLGGETAYDFEIHGAFYTQNGISYNRETISVSSLPPGEKKEVNLRLNVYKGAITTLKTQIYLHGKKVHEKESKSTFP
jgi:predicted transglutaminase-like cysteine proteinase